MSYLFLIILVTCSCVVQQSLINQEHYGRTTVENGNVVGNNGVILTSEANSGGQSDVIGGFLQGDEHALMASGVYIGLCEGKMGSPMSMRNGGFSDDNETIKEQNGFHVDTVE